MTYLTRRTADEMRRDSFRRYIERALIVAGVTVVCVALWLGI